MLRCDPGCQTLTAALFQVHAWTYGSRPAPCSAPAYRRKRRVCVTRLCRMCDFCGRRSRPRLHPLGELALEQSVLVDLAVDGARPDQLGVRPARRDPPAVEDDE